MARRITRHKVPEDIQKMRSEAQSKLQSAERDAACVASSIGAMQAEVSRLKKHSEELEKRRSGEQSKFAAIELELDEKRQQLRTREGDINKALSGKKQELSELDARKAKAQEALESVVGRYKSTLDAYEKQRQSAREQTESQEERLNAIILKTEEQALKIAPLQEQERRLLDITGKELPAAEQRLEDVGQEETQVRYNVAILEEILAATQANYNEEKAKYEEAHSLRINEERRVELTLVKLIEKEEEVENKLRSLRQVQLGVDQSIKRLERREHEVELKLHLAKKPSAVTET